MIHPFIEILLKENPTICLAPTTENQNFLLFQDIVSTGKKSGKTISIYLISS